MRHEICYYYVDNNPSFKFDTFYQAKEFAEEICKEFRYYPSITVVANVFEN